jgi:hypothetical protein
LEEKKMGQFIIIAVVIFMSMGFFIMMLMRTATICDDACQRCLEMALREDKNNVYGEEERKLLY